MPEQLPIWLNSGVEPPETLKTNGWQPMMKPSAQHMNWLFNRIYAALKELQDGGDLSLAEKVQADLAKHMADEMKHSQQLKEYASGKDENGFFTTIEYRRTDNTLFMKSVLSNPDANGYYRMDTWTVYATNGTTVIKTIKWTLTYDADGDVTSKVPA